MTDELQKENAERADRARQALAAYASDEDTKTAIVDLIADLCHLMATEHIVVEDVISTAQEHYDDEQHDAEKNDE